MATPRKIVITGPESTGKSTLSATLAKALHTLYNPEAAREYLENLGRPYEETDLLNIAMMQLSEEDTRMMQATNFLICDTDLFVLKVWSEAKYNRCHHKILASIAAERADLYLLTDIDMPWAYDPLREHPAPEDRKYFFRQYLDIVVNSGIPFAIVSGNEEERLARALAAIATIM